MQSRLAPGSHPCCAEPRTPGPNPELHVIREGGALKRAAILRFLLQFSALVVSLMCRTAARPNSRAPPLHLPQSVSARLFAGNQRAMTRYRADLAAIRPARSA